MRKEVIAILCSDLHLSHTAPKVRSGEPDWYKAMARPLSELRRAGNRHGVPIICAGDIFHRWESSPSIINFALGALPPSMWTIPGQHDIPDHNIDQIHRSAYRTLDMSRRISDMSCMMNPVAKNAKLEVYAFPFGKAIHPPTGKRESAVRACVAHRYYWTRDACYELADAETMIRTTTPREFRGYDVVILGDNHHHFKQMTTHGGNTTMIYNCGSMTVRRSDEIGKCGYYGILYDDTTIETIKFDSDEDRIEVVDDMSDIVEERLDMDSLAEELSKLAESDLDFATAMRRYLRANPTRKQIRAIIMEALKHGQE